MTATLPVDIFNIGDRVSIVCPNGNDHAVVGTCGTVVYVRGEVVGVDHDVEVDGMHDCLGMARDRHGWFYRSSHLKLVDQEPSVADVDIGAFV